MRLGLTHISWSVVLISYACLLERYMQEDDWEPEKAQWMKKRILCVIDWIYKSHTKTSIANKMRSYTLWILCVHTVNWTWEHCVLPMHSQRPTYLICAAYFMKPTIVFSAPRRRWVFLLRLFFIYKSSSAPHSAYAYVCRLKFLYLFIQNSNALRFY